MHPCICCSMCRGAARRPPDTAAAWLHAPFEYGVPQVQCAQRLGTQAVG